jgi:hypothetical protein
MLDTHRHQHIERLLVAVSWISVGEPASASRKRASPPDELRRPRRAVFRVEADLDRIGE